MAYYRGPDDKTYLVDDDTVPVGFVLMTAQEVAEAEKPKPLPIPDTITMRQARLALHGAGLLDAVNAAVDAAGGAALIEWEYAQEVQRHSPLVRMLAPALGLTGEQVDALFVAGAEL